jgi:hypothetical protein
VELEDILVGVVIGIPIGMVLMWGLMTFLSQKPSPSFSLPPPQKTYSNTEEWEMVRDPKTGRLKGIRVIREAKVG